MAYLGDENTALFYHCFKNDFINGQLNPARIYPCFIPCINKDLLMANLGNENTFLFYHWFKYDFISGQFNPARIYPCFTLYISKDLLMAKFIVQEYIRVLTFKKTWFYPCIYPWPVTFRDINQEKIIGES